MPVDLPSLAAFVLAATAIVVSPGPDTMLILRYALASGRPAGFAAVAGVQLGLLVHTALAAAGVSALIVSSPLLFKALAIAGAGYLGWLGVKSLHTSGSMALEAKSVPNKTQAITLFVPCRDALVCNVLNPKVIVLFLALYPNFLKPGNGEIAMQIAILSGILVLINCIWQVALALCADLARHWLVRPDIQRAIGCVTGAILLAFAVAMLLEHVV
jgi:threonine/homoserine/homoserine lactone efflux protein